MKKKISLFAVLTVLLLSLVSCGTNLAEESDLYGYSPESIKSDMENMTQTLSSLDDISLAYYTYIYQETAETSSGDEKTQAEILVSMLEGWTEASTEVGTFVGFGDFTVEKAGKTITATLDLDYTDRDAEIVYVYTIVGSRMSQTGATINLQYSLGETMGRAALNVVMGMAIVFVVLIIIMAIIFAFNLIPKVQKAFENRGKKNEAQNAVTEVKPTVTAATDDTELIAVIAAAIAASTGASTDDFVVRSIKRRY